MILVLASSRAWVWPVLLAVVAGACVLGRVGARALEEVPGARDAYRAAWRRSWRPISTTGVALAWTVVYALYALSLPTLGPVLRVHLPGLAAPASSRDEPAPTTTLTTARPSAAPTGGVFAPPILPGPSMPAPTPPAATTKPAPAVGCSLAAAGDAVAQVQVAVEQLTGRMLGADLSLVVEALAGCGDAENAALSLLGPINQLLNDAGVPVLHLPSTPELAIPRVPEVIAAPLRPTVFDACGRLTPQLLTVAAVAPVARISTEDAIRVLRYVTAVCSSFAPESS